MGETYGSAKIMQQDIEKTGKNLLWYMDFQILLFQTPSKIDYKGQELRFKIYV